MTTIKDMVKGTKVHFAWFANNEFWYRVDWVDSDSGENKFFEFPVPLSDIGNATLHYEDKAILFMRYIRKHLDLIEQGND